MSIFSLFFQRDACFSVENKAFIEVNKTKQANSPYQRKTKQKSNTWVDIFSFNITSVYRGKSMSKHDPPQTCF